MEPNNSSNFSSNPSQKVLEFFKKVSSSPILMLKVAVAAVVALVVLAFAFQLIGSFFRTLAGKGPLGSMVGNMIAPTPPGYGGSYGMGGGYDTQGADYDMAVSSDYYDGGYGTKAGYAVAPSMPELSARNVASSRPASISMPYPTPYPQSGTPGDNAEEFEVTQYNATIETRHIEDTCSEIAGLKSRTDVIFENANTGDSNCSFTFKVKHASVDEILAKVKALDPKDISESSYTIKRQIDDYTNEVDVLEKKRASIDETLKSAIAAYNEVTVLATRSQNADALAQIINSKIAIIERMTQERININEQLDRLSRAKADQLDQLDYSYFYVNVYENKFLDGEQLMDSWKQAIREFVWNVNKVVQDVSINLILLLLVILQWVLYAAIVLVVIKYGWKIGRYIWLR